MTTKWVKWTVDFESNTVREEYRQLFESGKITREDNKVLKKWVEIIEREGPEAIANTKYWDDHELHDDWKGYRSSCLSGPFRVIYKIVENKLLISIARVTPDHNYRR